MCLKLTTRERVSYIHFIYEIPKFEFSAKLPYFGTRGLYIKSADKYFNSVHMR